MFRLKFHTNNAAFLDDNEPIEVSRILEEIANKISNGKYSGLVIDVNGNNVGTYELN